MKGLPVSHVITLAVVPSALAAGIALGDRLNFGSRYVRVEEMPGRTVRVVSDTAQPTEITRFDGRPSSESPELRALRLDEVEMFPEFAGLPPAPMPTTQSACQTADYSRSGSFDLLSQRRDFLAGLELPDLPVRRHERVAKYLQYFTSTVQGRKLFLKWFKRSGRYRDLIAEHLSRYDLPQDLVAVVFIESGFWPTARSTAGATGLWQFMKKTGAAYGLVVRSDYDERRSIWASTDAAARHLDDLHTRFNSWDLALAAYNAGYERIERLTREMGTEDFWQLAGISEALPRETALYVPKILAIAVIINNLEVFGFNDIELEPALRAEPIEVPPHVRLSLVARAAGTSVRTLKELNPQLMTQTTPEVGGPLQIFVPADGVSRARAMLPRLLGGDSAGLDVVVSDDFDWGRDPLNPRGLSALELAADTSNDRLVTKPSLAMDTKTEAGVVYEVMAGDTLNKISEAFGVPMRVLARVNGLGNPSLIQVGQRLRLPLNADVHEKVPVVQEIVYRVRRGETLGELADYFGASVRQLALDNQIHDPRSLQEGQLLRVRVAALRPSTDEASNDEEAEQAQPSPAGTGTQKLDSH